MVVLVLAQREQSRVGGGRCPFFSSSCLSLILSLMRIKKMGQDRILAEARKNLEDSAPKL